MATRDDSGFDLDTARFTPEDLPNWPIDELPAPGEDLTGTVMMPVPSDIAQRLREAADRDGLSVAEELEQMLGRSA